MRELSLQAAQSRAKLRTTVPADDHKVNALTSSSGTSPPSHQEVSGAGTFPPQAGGAPSYVSTWAGFVCLATVLDYCTKKVVGYAMADHMRTSLVCEAIDMAMRRRPVEKDVTTFPLRPGQSVHVSEVPEPA